MKYSEAKECIQVLDRSGFEDLIDQYGVDVIEAAIYLGISPSDIAEAYQGEYSNDREFAQDMADQLGSIDKNASWPQTCIDWDHAARELMYDYAEHNGFYFRNL